MGKYIFLIMVFLLFASAPVQAESLEDKKAKYDQQLQDIQEQIKNTDDKQELINLNMQRNDIQAYQRAYEVALNLDSPAKATMTFLNKEHPPAEYIPIYKDAANSYGIEWTLLAAVHKIETSFSTHSTMISSAGAVGHMQFMPGTWEIYGIDGNGDGQADPWNLQDAVYSAAHYLSDTGAADEQIEQALFNYNQSAAYGHEVMNLSESYREAYSSDNVPVVNVGKRLIGKTTYVFGGGRTQNDIEQGIFDCSSFVHWAFAQVGTDLGNRATVTTDALKHMGQSVSINDIQPGDLVFFDTYKKDGHVGIYTGDGKFIGAQESTGVAVADMTAGYWSDKFNGRIVRI